jgi:hypothetical protein
MTRAASTVRGARLRALFGCALCLACWPAPAVPGWGETEPPPVLRQTIPILGVSGRDRTGVVLYVTVSLEKRQDERGLVIRMMEAPGTFSPTAERAIEQGIERTARALGFSSASWTVTVAHSYPGVTIAGDSLGAMVGLSVAALAQGVTVPADLAMTGTVAQDGVIGSVGALQAKVSAAGAAKLRRVLVPEQDVRQDRRPPSSSWPALVSVRTVQEAFQLLRKPSPESVTTTE